MTTKNIPVSFEFFKKYTYHEEWVERMLKVKANGHQETFEALLSSEESKEKALRSYYEAFYLKPQIREKSHIRLKAVPKKIKDKLLAIPVQDASIENGAVICDNNEEMQDAGGGEIVEEQLKDGKGSKSKKEKLKQRILMTARDVCDVDDGQVVEDDSEPLGSPDISSIPKLSVAKGKANSPLKVQGKELLVAAPSKASTSSDSNNTTILKPVIGKIAETTNKKIIKQQGAATTKVLTDKQTEIMDTNNNNNKPLIANTESNKFPPSVNADNGKHFNYKDLVPYIHCCPLTLKEFRKYSNIKQLAKELCKTKHMDDKHQRVIEQRSYILFYLAPEHRKITPLNKIQMLDNCPEDIKSKFFVIPNNLYLKKQDLDKTQENIESKSVNEVESVRNKEEQLAATVVKAVNSVKESNINQKATTSSQPAESANEIPPSVDVPVVVNENQQIIPEHINETNQPPIISCSTAQTTDAIIHLPVSLEEFKKRTHFEEVVEKLFKIKAQDNEELFNKYKNSQEAFNTTIFNYYQAFYLIPTIRETFPIRFKPMPSSLKNRLLQIPEGINRTSLNNFRIEDVVSVEFNAAAEVEKEAVTAGREETAKALNNSNTSQSSPTNTSIITIKTEKDTESSDSDSKTNSPSSSSTKRTTTEDMKSPLAKRQKTQETQDNTENTEKAKKSYKELLPYAHCCPISFSDFRKYTNVSELFAGYCQKRYNSLKKLPYMLQRAYVLYYLAPENRNFKPFCKLITLDECPADLKEKMHQIPDKLYLKGENATQQMDIDEMQTEKFKENQSENFNPEQTAIKPNNNRNSIEILENRLLPPTQIPFTGQVNVASQCLNNNCVFHYITHVDFTQLSNILYILREPSEIAIIQSFKIFVYRLLKEQSCDVEYNISASLLCKLFKYNKICEKCENDIRALFHQDSITACNESAKESSPTSAPNNEAVSERSESNNERIETNQEEATVEMESTESQTVNKGFNTKATESATESGQSQVDTPQIQEKSQDLWKNLKSEKIFQKFCLKLLTKLKQSFDNAIDFCSDTYEIFLQCNEIPLEKLLNDFCLNNKDIVERILNNAELYEALQRYFYYKYITNTKFALKYPVKIKENVKETQSDKSNTTIVEANTKTPVKTNAVKITTPKASEKQNDNVNQATNSPEKPISNNNIIEKAKRIFFRNVEKTNTFSYILRTSFGLKQLILRTILSLTFQEFLQLTSVYEGKQLYNDNHLTECMYRYVFRTPVVWPTNLFITLKDLCEFLHIKNIRFTDYSTMLKHISPKLLHWSVLLSCTNILDCVKLDYEKRTGKLLDTDDIKTLKQECIEYYNRCWKYEKWLGDVPLVNEEFYKDYLNNNDQGDATMLNESALQEVCIETEEVSDDVAMINNDIEVEAVAEIGGDRPTEINTSQNQSIKEFNCVLLPNTQQQIEMLPAEARVSNDPLNNSNNANTLNVTSSTNSENYEVVCLGELIANDVKTEPLDSKLLTNLLFYEDENSNMQCEPCLQEIVDLDDSAAEVCENLPPSQIEFGDALPEPLLSTDLTNNENSNSLMNLAQRLPSSAETYNESTGTQQFVQEQNAPVIQMINVSLRSSGENGSQEQQQQDMDLKDNTEELEVIKVNTQEFELLQTSLQSFAVYAEAQRFPSTFEETPTCSGSLSAEPTTSILLQQELIKTSTLENSDLNAHLVSNEVSQPTVLNTLQTSQQANTALPKRRGFEKTYSAVKSSKSIATVRPIKNSNFVPQIQHNTRPLLTKPAYTASSSRNNKALPSEQLSEQPPGTSLTPIEEDNSVTNEQCVDTLPSVGTIIQISQEFQKNCSVFNNTSLLRLVDHNYQKQSQTSLPSSLPSTQTQNEELAKTVDNDGNQQQLQTCSLTLTQPENEEAAGSQQQQPVRRTTRRSSMLGSQPTNPPENTASSTDTTSNQINPPVSPTRATRSRSSLCKDSKDKVNNPLLTSHTNNPIATIAPTPHQQHPHKMVTKLCLYRQINKFHYFKELTAQHICKYLLPSLEYGKSYTEATIVCENFKTRISNRSISALFPFWSQSLQRDFLLVLSDLKEFHYVTFESERMQKHDDLRARILYWLLNTAPSFALCQFVCEANNTEFSYCETIKNANNPSYKRKPFKCLSNALSSKVLDKIREKKRNSKKEN
ncbi:uncharacterized protein LOC119606057 isoform X3 [Lucilia sericata]|uniref:uncharacterized protein LOC119606057 isoform X3 n=1 Tax=Lucilia sericata TaxID=13632 RepID=UPI0018A80F65|nr:uncharacterized protein LOC119606057 isoform X3 [Lucilia sericata]